MIIFLSISLNGCFVCPKELSYNDSVSLVRMINGLVEK